MDIIELSALLTAIAIIIGAIIWIVRLELRVRDLEKNPLLEAFKNYVKKDGVPEFLGKMLADFERRHRGE